MIDIRIGDCLERLKLMADESVHCVMTSPPYWGLRDYKTQGQIGLEPTPDEYIARLVGVFREVRRVLRGDGTLWLNMGDSYYSPWVNGAVGEHSTISSTRTQQAFRDAQRAAHSSKQVGASVVPGAPGRRRGIQGLKAKDLVGIPWMLAFALRADGWHLRQDIIWAKPNPMPESVRDRCTKSHEHLFLLTKSRRYHFDAAAIAETSLTGDMRRPYGSEGAWQMDGRDVSKRHGGKPRFVAAKIPAGRHQGTRGDADPRYKKTQARPPRLLESTTSARNKRDVWTIPTAAFKGAHFATFPPALVGPCILAGCPAGGLVLDPFAGSGTTGLVAARLQRDAILLEINPGYALMAAQRIRAEAPLLVDVRSDHPRFAASVAESGPRTAHSTAPVSAPLFSGGQGETT